MPITKMVRQLFKYSSSSIAVISCCSPLDRCDVCFCLYGVCVLCISTTNCVPFIMICVSCRVDEGDGDVTTDEEDTGNDSDASVSLKMVSNESVNLNPKLNLNLNLNLNLPSLLFLYNFSPLMHHL